MSQPIPEYARHDLAAVLDIAGSEEDYRDLIWRARRRGQPSSTRSRWKWPVAWPEAKPSNVEPIRAKGAR